MTDVTELGGISPKRARISTVIDLASSDDEFEMPTLRRAVELDDRFDRSQFFASPGRDLLQWTPRRGVGGSVVSGTRDVKACDARRGLDETVARRLWAEELKVAVEADEALARRLQEADDDQNTMAPVPRVKGPGCAVRRDRLQVNSAGASSAGTSIRSLAAGRVERLDILPRDLVRRVEPLVDVCGTSYEPVIFLRNVDGQRGRLLAGRVLDELVKCDFQVPSPRRGRRGCIVAEIHRRKRSKTPWRTGLHVLREAADQVMEYLSRHASSRVVTGSCAGAWHDTEVLVTTPGCCLGRHRDAQPAGSLLLVFCAGLSCRSQSWPNGQLVDRQLESGDVAIMDGKLTEHAVPQVLPSTSPFPDCAWLGSRRLAVLVRQRP